MVLVRRLIILGRIELYLLYMSKCTKFSALIASARSVCSSAATLLVYTQATLSASSFALKVWAFIRGICALHVYAMCTEISCDGPIVLVGLHLIPMLLWLSSSLGDIVDI